MSPPQASHCSRTKCCRDVRHNNKSSRSTLPLPFPLCWQLISGEFQIVMHTVRPLPGVGVAGRRRCAQYLALVWGTITYHVVLAELLVAVEILQWLRPWSRARDADVLSVCWQVCVLAGPVPDCRNLPPSPPAADVVGRTTTGCRAGGRGRGRRYLGVAQFVGIVIGPFHTKRALARSDA